MVFIRLSLAILLAIPSLWTIASNARAFWLRYIFRREDAPSVMPLVGGVLGVIAACLCWRDSPPIFYLLPLIVDAGCLPLLLAEGIVRLLPVSSNVGIQNAYESGSVLLEFNCPSSKDEDTIRVTFTCTSTKRVFRSAVRSKANGLNLPARCDSDPVVVKIGTALWVMTVAQVRSEASINCALQFIPSNEIPRRTRQVSVTDDAYKQLQHMSHIPRHFETAVSQDRARKVV